MVPLVKFFYQAKQLVTCPCITNETVLATRAEASNLEGFTPKGLSMGNTLMLFYYIKVKVSSSFTAGYQKN